MYISSPYQSFSSLSPSSNGLVSASKKLQRFGCQVALAVRPLNLDAVDHEASKSFLQNVFLFWENAFKYQSIPKLERSERIKKIVGPSIDLHRDTVSFLAGAEDAMGIRAIKNSPDNFLNLQLGPAHVGNKFDNAIINALTSPAHTIFAHLRYAIGRSKVVDKDNIHPFIHGPWTLMHQGTVQGVDEPKVMSKIQQFVKKHNVELNTEKAADSRLLFYYLLNNIEEAYQTLDPGKLTTDQLARTVAESIQTLRNPTGNEKEPLRISNLTFSDGKRTILFRDKIHKLFYTAKTLPSGKTEMVFASDPVLPIEPMKDETAYWGKVDENTLVKLVPQASSIETGQITLPELMNASGNGELFWRPLNKIKAFA